MQNPKFTIGESLKFGWETMTDNFFFFLAIIAIAFGFEMAYSFLLENLRSSYLDFLYIPATIIYIFVEIIISLGIINISLKFIKGEKSKIEDLFACYNKAAKQFVANLVYSLAVVIGLVLLIVPGVYIALKYQFYSYFIVEKNMGPIAALKASGEITKGYKLTLLGFNIIIILLNLVGILIFGIGLLFTIPMTLLAMAFIYKKLESGPNVKIEDTEKKLKIKK